MKIRFCLPTIIFATLTFQSQSLASGVIVQVVDSAQIIDIIDDYPGIVGIQQAGKAPFFRFDVESPFDTGFSQMLLSDKRILWAEEEVPTGFHGRYSSHGSSVAAIFDRSLSYNANSDIWKQVRFTQGLTGSLGVKVGIVDTGVSHRQTFLLSKVTAQASFVESSVTADDVPSLIDTNLNGVFDEGVGHGTMVTGVIVQMSPNSPLIVAKSADSDGVGTSWSVLQGVVFCVENGAKLVNLSLGSQREIVGFGNFLDWVEQSGTVVISPIGNDNSNVSLFPAAYSNVICVAGLLPNNTKAPFSNWSPLAKVSAPASGVASAWYDGLSAVWSGTSLSAPIVTGSIAAALAESPNRSPEQIRKAVANSGRDIDDLNPLYRGQLGKLLDFVGLLNALREQ